jgi:hypothetical protein
MWAVLPKFRRYMLPSYPEDGSSVFLRNVGNTANIYMVQINSTVSINKEQP